MSTDILPEAFQRVLVALLIGFLIGLDRERAEVRKKRRVFAGVRTFPLIALIGAMSVLLMDATGPLLAVASFLAVGAVTLVSYVRSSAAGAPGATTEIASIATFLLGALAGTGELLLSAALGIGVAVLLVAKPRLEGFSRALTEEEIAAALELAVISCIVLPLLPNRGYGPWDVWNPFDIWLVVVLVSAVSFAGFVAVRTLGQERGMTLAGVVGGLVSSTAVTAAMANRSREDVPLARPAASAAVLASVVMCGRVAVFAAAFGPGILLRLGPCLAAMAVAGTATAWLIGRGIRPPPAGAAPEGVSNPSSLRAALTFAVLYAAILLAVRAAQEHLGAAGMYVAAALSSVADVDAVTIAFARGGAGDDAWRTPAAAASLALVVNTLLKLGLAVVAGGGRFRALVGAALAFMALAGAAAAVAVFFCA
jgi:uncharacterized membrane protein (DUF4010 family)